MIGLLWAGILVLAFIGWLMLVGVCREENELRAKYMNTQPSVVETKR